MDGCVNWLSEKEHGMDSQGRQPVLRYPSPALRCSHLFPDLPHPSVLPAQVDVWAVGVLAYELMMGGATPFFNECTKETEKLIQQAGGGVAPGTVLDHAYSCAIGMFPCLLLDWSADSRCYLHVGCSSFPGSAPHCPSLPQSQSPIPAV